MTTPSNHEHFEHLVVKAVDGTLTAQERSELQKHLEMCAACAAELQDFMLIKETTDAMTARILRDAEIEAPRVGGSAKLLLNGSFLLLLVGVLLLVGFAGYSFWTDATVPVVLKVGSGAAALGSLGLLAYVLRVRTRASGRDPYEEIDQ